MMGRTHGYCGYGVAVQDLREKYCSYDHALLVDQTNPICLRGRRALWKFDGAT
jgi:hypothetical protein